MSKPIVGHIRQAFVILALPLVWMFAEFVWRMFMPRWVRTPARASMAVTPDYYRREGLL